MWVVGFRHVTLLTNQSWEAPDLNVAVSLQPETRQVDEVNLRLGSRLDVWSRGVWYTGTSLTRKRNHPGPYRRPMPRVLGGVLGR